jgi:hypothetical protein
VFSGFGSNYVARPLAATAFADASQRAAGLRSYGAFGACDAQALGVNPSTGAPLGMQFAGAGGSGQRVAYFENHFHEPPPDPFAWSRAALHAAQVEG